MTDTKTKTYGPVVASKQTHQDQELLISFDNAQKLKKVLETALHDMKRLDRRGREQEPLLKLSINKDGAISFIGHW